MKKWLHLLLVLALCCAPLADALAEAEYFVDAEALPAESAGDTGLVVDDGAPDAGLEELLGLEPEWQESVEPEPSNAEIVQASPAYAWIPAVMPVYAEPDAPEPFALLGESSAALILEAGEARWRIAFNSARGVVSGWAEISSFVPMDEAQTAALLDAIATSGTAALYEDDLNRPLPSPAVEFLDAPAEPAPEQPAEPEVGEAEAYGVMAQAEEIPAVSDLQLSATKLTIGVKDKNAVLTATLLPESSVGTVSWRTSSAKIVKVDSAGRLTGVKAGTATVYATTENGIEKKCTVTVKAAPNKVTLDAASLTLSVGETRKLSATLPKKTGSTLKYTSSKSAVAQVEADGTVAALTPGSAKITVSTFNGKKATCKVTVLAAPEQVFLPETFNIAELEHKKIQATVMGAGGVKSTATYTYSAEDGTGSATVDPATGEVTGVRAGTAIIRVRTHNGVTGHLVNGESVETVCAVTVTEGPTQVSLSARKVTIGVKQSYALNPVLLSAGGAEMSGSYTVTSSAPKKLSASAKGVIKGLSVGSYTVTVKAFNGVTETCSVKVVKAPSKVTVSPANPVVGVGQTIKLSAVYPKGSMASCTFSSSAKDIVSVTKDGYVTGLKRGTASIRARTHNGKATRITVTVDRGPEYLALNGEYELSFDPLSNTYSTLYTKTLSVGETFQLTYENEYNTHGDISGYESDAASVATVSDTGLVTAVGAGTAFITVRSTGGAEARLRVTVPGAPVVGISFPTSETAVQAGRTAPVPSLRGTNIDAATLAGATYVSSDANVFTVGWSEEEARWLIAGVNPGSATLTATAAGAVTQLRVNVVAAEDVREIHFEEPLVYMKVGESFAPIVADQGGSVVAATLSTDNGGVAAVDATGKVTAVAEGRATVTASFGALNTAMTVVVTGSDLSITLSATTLNLGVGQRARLRAQINGDGSTASLSYASDDPTVATVDRTGQVIARRAGATVVRVTANGTASASCAVNGAPAPSHIAVEPASVTGRVDEGGAQLKWSFGAPDEVGTVTFSSADTGVAEVSAEGYVTFRTVGVTTVTATTDNGLTATVSVMVLPQKPVSDTPSYRLFAAYSYFDSSYKGYIQFTRNNAKSMEYVFGKSSVSGLKYDTKVMGNPSKLQLLSGIAGYFASTTDNDVSIVYLCSHGHMMGDYQGYRMSLPGYDESKNNANYYLTSQEIYNCVSRIRGSVVLVLDSCYSGTFLEDVKGQLDAQNGRIAVLTAAGDTRATYYNVKDTSRAVDFFTFFLLQGLGYSARDGWWNANAKGAKGAYPGYLSADNAGNKDGIVTLGEFYDFAAKSIAVNIPNYMKKTWYWGDKTRVQAPRCYAGALNDLVIYQPTE